MAFTHAAECSPAGSWPAGDSGSFPSPPWALSPSPSPPATRRDPFLLLLLLLLPGVGYRREKERCCGGWSTGPHILLGVPQLCTVILRLQPGKFSWGSSPRLPAPSDLEQHGANPQWAMQVEQIWHDPTTAQGRWLAALLLICRECDWLLLSSTSKQTQLHLVSATRLPPRCPSPHF